MNNYIIVVKIFWHNSEECSEYVLENSKGSLRDAWDGSVAPSIRVFRNNKNVRAILYSMQEALTNF